MVFFTNLSLVITVEQIHIISIFPYRPMPTPPLCLRQSWVEDRMFSKLILHFRFKFVYICLLVGVHGSKVQGFKVLFSSPDSIWDAHLREKRQFRQASPKI